MHAPPEASVRTQTSFTAQLDESKKTATLVWEFPGNATVPDAWYTQSWYTPFWGDADRLANGDVLVTAGFRSTQLTHIFELRPSDGKVVWQITYPAGVGAYQAERLSPPPLVEPL